MRIAIGEDDDFAGFDHDGLPANDISVAPAHCDHMIRDQMIGTWQDLLQDHIPRRRFGDPRFFG
jgi:hypothetical protein